MRATLANVVSSNDATVFDGVVERSRTRDEKEYRRVHEQERHEELAQPREELEDENDERWFPVFVRGGRRRR